MIIGTLLIIANFNSGILEHDPRYLLVCEWTDCDNSFRVWFSIGTSKVFRFHHSLPKMTPRYFTLSSKLVPTYATKPAMNKKIFWWNSIIHQSHHFSFIEVVRMNTWLPILPLMKITNKWIKTSMSPFRDAFSKEALYT